MKFIKCLALLIPSIIGIALLIVVVLKFTGNMTDIKILEAKMDSMIGIIGVAVSVWIGLNVYSLVEKNEVDRLKELNKELEDKISKQDKLFDYIKALNEWRDIYNNMNLDVKNEIPDQRSLEILIFNAKTLISNFNHVKRINSSNELHYTINYHLQYSILLSLMVKITYFDINNKILVGADFIRDALREVTDILSVDNDELLKSQQVERKELLIEGYKNSADSYNKLEDNLNILGWLDNNSVKKISKIKELLDGIE